MNYKGKVDCFANKSNLVKDKSRLKKDGCKVLTEMICLTRECPFYKPKKEMIEIELAEYDF